MLGASLSQDIEIFDVLLTWLTRWVFESFFDSFASSIKIFASGFEDHQYCFKLLFELFLKREAQLLSVMANCVKLIQQLSLTLFKLLQLIAMILFKPLWFGILNLPLTPFDILVQIVDLWGELLHFLGRTTEHIFNLELFLRIEPVKDAQNCLE